MMSGNKNYRNREVSILGPIPWRPSLNWGFLCKCVIEAILLKKPVRKWEKRDKAEEEAKEGYGFRGSLAPSDLMESSEA